MKKVYTVSSNLSPEDSRVKEFRLKSNIVMLYSTYNTIGELEEDYKKFQAMEQGLKDDSNQESLVIFNKDNETRYKEMMNKFYQQKDHESINYVPKYEINKKDEAFLTYESAMNESFMDTLDKNRYRLYIQEDDSDYDIEDDEVKDTIDTNVKSSNLFSDDSVVYPMYTPDEIDKYAKDIYGNDRFNYTKDTRLKDSIWRRSYNQLSNGGNPIHYDFKTWINNIKTYYDMHNNQGLIECGWNPYIKPTDKAILEASNNTKKLYHDLANKVTLVDTMNFVSNESTDEYPNNKFNLGLVITEDSKVTFVPAVNHIKASPEENIDVYICRESNSNIHDHLNAIVNQKFKDIKLESNNNGALKLYLYNIFNEARVQYPVLFHIYSGLAKDYDNVKQESFSVINSILNKEDIYHREIQSEAVTTNEFPVEFTKDGDLLISKGRNINFEGEYSRCHLALKLYEKNKNITGMKYCICKLWYLNILLEDIIHDKKTTPAKRRECLKVRAKIINDITYYSNIVLKEDPNFDIIKTYENSPFNNDKVRISSSTLAHTVDWIKRLLTFKNL